MNILTTCKTTAIAALCLGTAVTCFAQGKNIIKGTSKGIFEAPRLTRGTVQRYVFPRQTVENIRRGINAGALERGVSGIPLSQATLPALPQAASFNSLTLVVGRSVEKEVLASMLEENKFYAPEIDAGRAIRQQILDITVLEDEGQLAIAQNIQAHIKNHTLKALLLEELSNFDIYNMALDLTDYFCLDKPFEDAAFDYTLRHPHQMNLNLRRLMYNPLVDDGVKNRLKYFLSSTSLVPEEYDAFRAAIRTAHLQYQQRLTAAKYSEVIQAQIAYYEDLAKRLDDFIVQNNGVQPKWNTTNPVEQTLFDEYETLAQYDFVNQFNPILSYRKKLQIIWDTAQAPRILSQEETVALYEEFVKTTHRRYPHSLRNASDAVADEIHFEQEELLWDSLNHWRSTNESTIHPKLTRVLSKYTTHD